MENHEIGLHHSRRRMKKKWLVWGLIWMTAAFTPAAPLAGERSIIDGTKDAGKTDQTVYLDPTGEIRRLEADTNGDGCMDTVQYYKNQVVVRIERNVNKASGVGERDFLEDGKLRRREKIDKTGRIIEVMIFDNREQLRAWHRDTNGKGSFDIRTSFRSGEPISQEEDTDHDGRMDRYTEFDSLGRPVLMRESDEAGAGRKRVIRYQDGRLLEQEIDEDGDGFFETTAYFEDSGGCLKMEIFDSEGKILERHEYTDDELRKKTVFDTADGRPIRIEEFDKTGRMVLSREADANSETLNLTWHYNAAGSAVRAEKDQDGDGRTDIWFFYNEGRITQVEEDQNRDGKPDLWEIYDAAQTVVRRSEDLDFDGIADTTVDF